MDRDILLVRGQREKAGLIGAARKATTTQKSEAEVGTGSPRLELQLKTGKMQFGTINLDF